jgi:hypothetical protein
MEGTTMVQALAVEEQYAVRVNGGKVVIDGLVEDDPGVVALVEEASDPDRAVRACLQIGARASIMAGASLESLEMERAFGELVDGFGATVAEAVTQIVGTAEGLVDEDDGPFPVMLRQLKGDLATQLDTLFDPESKSSALARMEKVFSEAASLHTKSMRAVLDPSDAKSPLGQWKAEVLGTVKEQVGLVLTQVTEMAATTAATQAHKETFALTAVKGHSFEENLHPVIAELAARHGDLAEHVGAQSGSSGSKRGDEVVHLNQTDTGGRSCAIVFEAKDRKLGMRKIMEELEEAIMNRAAACGVAVFARPVQSPTAVPFTFSGNKGIVVLDDGAESTQVLELAYMWARGEARKALAGDADALDVTRIEAAMGDAHRALTRVSTVRRCHTTAKKQIDQASGEVDALVDDVEAAQAQLRLELAS